MLLSPPQHLLVVPPAFTVSAADPLGQVVAGKADVAENLADVATPELMKRYREIAERVEEQDLVPEDRQTFAELVTPDLRQRAQDIERELDRRGQKFKKIVW